MKSKNAGVKCYSDGELPCKRKAEMLAVRVLHPASYGKNRNILFISFFTVVAAEEVFF